jgi:RNA recognition motif-containing protein
MIKKTKKDREIVKVIHDNNFEIFLKNLNVYESVLAGNSKCKFCGNPITFDAIYTVFPESGAIKFACDCPACIAKMNSYLNEK